MYFLLNFAPTSVNFIYLVFSCISCRKRRHFYLGEEYIERQFPVRFGNLLNQLYIVWFLCVELLWEDNVCVHFLLTLGTADFCKFNLLGLFLHQLFNKATFLCRRDIERQFPVRLGNLLNQLYIMWFLLRLAVMGGECLRKRW